jgi:hypothetical protein
MQEMEAMSNILPIISYKLSNLNINDYINDFNKKILTLRDYGLVIKNFLIDKYDKNKFKQAQDLQAYDANESLHDFDSKLNLIKRIVDECLHRLHIQSIYLDELNDFFMNLTEKCLFSNDSSFEKSPLDIWMLDIKNKLYKSQSNVIEYARESLDKKCLLKSLSFYSLIDILNRFSFIYNLKAINFA